MTTPKKILVPLDIHQKQDNALLLESAVEMAQNTGATLAFLNVIDVDLDSAMIDRFDDVKAHYAGLAEKQLQELIAKKVPSEISSTVNVASGRSYSKVVDVAKEMYVDLIMLAAHKEGMKEFLLGMTAARVVRHAHCSVMVVRD
ncbi:universal stress protein [Lentibacter algarum]|uniref:universal stress protein n=1 Tax=Lentibacter algarum TaxID=576131 RepID=UPI001C099757|nr:universal stress protein [Lentibacter algarum]MBU2983660.1 universal stress protein [Lentibacter algarum]